MKQTKIPGILLVLLIITFIPWLGLTDFNTKGEPREAIVALSMINSGDYILPVSFGTDIPYKPPFLAWLIALVSAVTGGVSEFSSRLPSAIATILMAMGCYRFFARRRGDKPYFGACVALVTVTAFEVFRAATACRVDMVLTACMVGAMLALYSAWERRGPSISWGAIALMTCAVLTKGPVGMILPCLVAAIFMLIKGEKPLKVTGILVATGLLSLVIPALWYIAAYRQGGEDFLNLVMEENFGRFTGSMSYRSHENPIYYNFLTLFAGMAPYTLLCIFALIGAGWKRRVTPVGQWLAKARKADPVTLYSAVAAVTVFVFYCIPKSKRSVYLLPMYPFVAYFITLMIVYLVRNRPRPMRGYAWLIAILAVVLPMVLLTISMTDPHWLATTLHLKASTAVYLEGLHGDNGVLEIILPLITLLCGTTTISVMVTPRTPFTATASTLLTTVAIYWTLSGSVFPAVLNVKSDKEFAHRIAEEVPEGEIYAFDNDDMLRYYSIAFYTGDRVRIIDNKGPWPSNRRIESGWLLIGSKEFEEVSPRYGDAYRISPVISKGTRSCDLHDTPMLMYFTRR